MSEMDSIQREIVDCRLCPRLVEWRERVAREKVKRFAHEDYWGRPVPSFGDPEARLLVIGLAPAAHGGNRTGRVFTGDRSGDWLYRALYRAGFANQPTSTHAGDGLELRDCWITAAAHSAPPDNKPLPEELRACRPYLLRELDALRRLRVIVALGKIGFDTIVSALGARRLQFGHGVEHRLDSSVTLVGCYHPSQQNTFTGRLTEPMLDAVFSRARELATTDEHG